MKKPVLRKTRAHPNFKIKSVGNVASKNRVFLLIHVPTGKTYFVKAAGKPLSSAYPKEGFKRDLAVSRFVSRARAGISPEFIMAESPSHSKYFIQQYVRHLRKFSYSKDATNAARLLAKLHKIKMKGPLPRNLPSNPILCAALNLKFTPKEKETLRRKSPHFLEFMELLEQACTALLPAAKRLLASPQALCHNDTVAQNWIVGKRGRLYLVDFEWAALSHPAFEIASFASPFSFSWSGAKAQEGMEEKFMRAYCKASGISYKKLAPLVRLARHFVYLSHAAWIARLFLSREKSNLGKVYLTPRGKLEIAAINRSICKKTAALCAQRLLLAFLP